MTLTGKTALAGVMGWPVSHSLSPRLHGYWLRKYGIDGAYVPLPVAPQNIGHVLQSLPKLGFRGVNVTVPHKETVLPFLDTVSDIARNIGAVNTIFVSDQDTLIGTNTDAAGFLSNLQLGAPAWQATSCPAVVLGAGGAARAVVAALVEAQVPEIRLINRTHEKAVSMAESLDGPITVMEWSSRESALADAGLIVNTTTLGMINQPPLELSLAGVSSQVVVNDLVYTPLETPLLKAARDQGLVAVDGLGMLLHQAVVGFEGWFGHRPDVDSDLRQFMLDAA